MATIQKTSRRGLFPTFGRSGLLISSRQWWRREGGSLTFLFCTIVDLLRFDSTPQVPTQHPPSVVMKLDVEGRFIWNLNKHSHCHPFNGHLSNHYNDFKPSFCATSVFWEQLQRELDVVPDLVMSGALQHIDHLHVDWTRFCFESLGCLSESL